MRKNLGVKTAIYPQPALMLGTWNEDGTANMMYAAWGGVSDYDELTIACSKEHKTTENFLRTGALTVSIGTVETVAPCDYVGTASGNDVADKAGKAGFHAVKAENVDAPIFEELPLAIECKVKEYCEETGKLTAEIVNVSVCESIMTDDKIDMTKFHPFVFCESTGEYLALGDVLGFAWNVGAEL
ncbi:MAG: flavin oxidoreductase [Clostridiales bacterium]|nr:flavin oxidoreductase [Clostridiales bacterium]